MHKNSLSGYLFALTAVFFWSINLIIASSFATSLMPMEIAFGRWLIAGVILLFIARKKCQREFFRPAAALETGSGVGSYRHGV